MVFNYILFGCPWVLYFTSSNSKINDKFNTNIRLTDTFESSNKLVKVFYGSKESSTPLQPFLPWGFANFEPFTCLPKVNNVYNNIILQIEYFQDFKRPKIAPCLKNDTRSGKPRVCILPMVPCCSSPVSRVSRSRLCKIRSSWGKGWIKAASLDFSARSFWFRLWFSTFHRTISCLHVDFECFKLAL